MIDPAVLDAMLAAGASAEVIVAAVKADQAKDETRLEAKRANNAERQQRYRDRHNASNALRDVTGVTSPAPLVSPLPLSPDPLPQPPYNPPTPINSVRAKAVQFVEPKGVETDSWQAFRKQRKKPLTQIAYDRILKTLEDGKAAGWPPGELVDLAIERGWETVFVPKEQRNGRRPANAVGGFGQQGSRTLGAALDFIADGEPH